jgi:hypothetical protein
LLRSCGLGGNPASVGLALGVALRARKLRLAREEGANVLTADLDYPRLLALTGSEGPGILLFRGGDWGEKEILERLEHTLAIVSEDELPHSILVIERRRIRRRRLPVTSQSDS